MECWQGEHRQPARNVADDGDASSLKIKDCGKNDRQDDDQNGAGDLDREGPDCP